jgi:hypothetical protein
VLVHICTLRSPRIDAVEALFDSEATHALASCWSFVWVISIPLVPSVLPEEEDARDVALARIRTP